MMKMAGSPPGRRNTGSEPYRLSGRYPPLKSGYDRLHQYRAEGKCLSRAFPLTGESCTGLARDVGRRAEQGAIPFTRVGADRGS
jgi:hypothetical protein